MREDRGVKNASKDFDLSSWPCQCHFLTMTWKGGVDRGVEGRQRVSFGLANFHMPLSNPKEDNEVATGYTGVELREVVQAGHTNVGISVCV